MKDCCKEVLEALQIMQTAIDNALVPKEDKDQKDCRIAFNEWVNSTKSATFDPPQIVCDSYEQKGVFVPAERPTPKPILHVGVGFNSARGVTDEEIKDLLSETCTTIAAKTNNEYYVICVIDYTFEHGLNFKVL
tara:strand:+ start:97 stop:498 length:402 start_codon:yes stop_codon:yes gene_type:complete